VLNSKTKVRLKNRPFTFPGEINTLVLISYIIVQKICQLELGGVVLRTAKFSKQRFINAYGTEAERQVLQGYLEPQG